MGMQPKDKHNKGDIQRSAGLRPSYLNGFANVFQGRTHSDEEAVEAHHFLHKHSVHALLVGGGVLAQRCLCVKVGGQFGQDVPSHFVHHIVSGLASSR